MKREWKIGFVLPETGYDLLILLGSVLLGILVAVALLQSVKLLLRKTTSNAEALFVNTFKSAFVLLGIVVSANIGLGFVVLGQSARLIMDKALYLLLIFSVSFLVIRLLSFLRDVLYSRYDSSTISRDLEQRKARTQIDFLQRMGTLLVVMVAFAIALMSFSRVRELGTSILASAGLAGIILGFAAQKSIANLLAGLQIAFTQPIRIGDSVIVESQFGRVEEIGLTYVVVKIWDDRRLILPISYFIEKPFENWTRQSAEILGSVMLYADYTLPIDPLREELKRILANEGSKWWDGRVGVVQVTDCSDSSLQIRILISASDSASAFDLKCTVRENMIKFIRSNFPDSLPKQRLAHLTDVPSSSPKINPGVHIFEDTSDVSSFIDGHYHRPEEDKRFHLQR